jgi:hypothetical protein
MTEFDKLADRLYGKNGMGVGDVKIFCGLHNASAESIAAQINIFFDEAQLGAVEVVYGDVDTPEKAEPKGEFHGAE